MTPIASKTAPLTSIETPMLLAVMLQERSPLLTVMGLLSFASTTWVTAAAASSRVMPPTSTPRTLTPWCTLP